MRGGASLHCTVSVIFMQSVATGTYNPTVDLGCRRQVDSRLNETRELPSGEIGPHDIGAVDDTPVDH